MSTCGYGDGMDDWMLFLESIVELQGEYARTLVFLGLAEIVSSCLLLDMVSGWMARSALNLILKWLH